ncbi:MAG: hypothetical protein MUF69_03770 [Desulfobacterota bacterium]|jgi:hypothetical protein|nr:hypothetical protein [Thermodesulfobacteriota bacterium]
MPPVHQLTGKDCRYYQRRRCIRPRAAHPPEAEHCLVIIERKKIGHWALDRLKRLERFNLPRQGPDRTIAEKYIVDRNLWEMTKIQCKNFIESGTNFPPCLHQVGVLCALKMPVCPGRCPEYELHPQAPRRRVPNP